MIIRINKKKILLLLLITTVILCFSSTFFIIAKTHYELPVIVIDAGHGGVDGGVKGTISGVKESDLNLAVSKKIKLLLEEKAVKVVMTRENENGLYSNNATNRKNEDFRKRKEIIKKANADLVISIHMNKFFEKKQRGAQVFYSKKSEKGKKFAFFVQTILKENIEFCNRVILPGDYYIINCSNTPSILIECGFLSNNEEEKLLITDIYQEKLAKMITQATLLYLGIIPFA